MFSYLILHSITHTHKRHYWTTLALSILKAIVNQAILNNNNITIPFEKWIALPWLGRKKKNYSLFRVLLVSIEIKNGGIISVRLTYITVYTVQKSQTSITSPLGSCLLLACNIKEILELQLKKKYWYSLP